MLSKLDDYPVHQTPLPVRYSASSDRFTYNRFWYGGHQREGRYYIGVGMSRYPNLGILDCGFSLVIDGRQYAFHGSRRAPVDPYEMTVGPFDLQILEPMGRHRLVISPNDTGLECDLTFIPKTAAVEEGRQTLRNERHVIMDATRLDQFGSWEGTIKYAGKTLEVKRDDCLGIKDRSWGIRPCGEAYTGGAPIDVYKPTHFIWLPIHWEDECSLAGFFEDENGYQWHTDQVFLPVHHDIADSDIGLIPVNDPGARIWEGRVEHQIEFIPGTRQARRASFRMNDRNGDSMEIQVEPLLCYRMKGIGYMHPEWAHGVWKGELAFAGESWNCDEVDPLALENMHLKQVVRATSGDKVGYGELEQIHIGPHSKHAFKELFDGAP